MMKLDLFSDIFRKNIKLLFPQEYELFFESLILPPNTSIRINADKVDDSSIVLSEVEKDPVQWSTQAYYLSQRPIFTLDPLFHAGAYYVQEASSAFLEQCILEIRKHVKLNRVLDLCAAPGGKSTHLSNLIGDALLVCNEVIKGRANILLENMEKWGTPNSVITNNDPRDFNHFTHFFDLIWVDAPCSGEGMFRKDPRALAEWSEANVKFCAARQRRILSDIWECLVPGGFLAYSTCTFNTLENEENIQWLREEYGAESIEIPICPTWNIAPSVNPNIYAYRFYPHKVRGEGFFVSLVQKPMDSIRTPKLKIKNKSIKFVENWLTDENKWCYYDENNIIYASLDNYFADIDNLCQKLRVLGKGVRLAEVKGKDLIPSYTLPISSALNTSSFPIYELDETTALLYLKKENIRIPDNISSGYVIVTFKGIPLGLVKKIQNRANNLFPNSWRIRMKLD